MGFQTLNGKQIRNQSLEDRHIKGKLSESVLDIVWSDPAHAEQILRNKIITDYVQYSQLLSIPNGASSHNVDLAIDTSDNALPGVVVDTPLRLRDKNGDPIQHDGKEVTAKLVKVVAPQSKTTTFTYTMEFTDSTGAPFSFNVQTEIEFLYPIKTTLWDASENFASNERFVDGAVDIRTKMDLLQIAKDIFGDGYIYNANGEATVGETLLAALDRLTSGSLPETTAIVATDIIDEVFVARDGHDSLLDRLTADRDNVTQALDDFKAELVSDADTKGTALVGHHDSLSLFLSTNLSDIINEIGGLLKDAEGSKTSVTERLNESLRPSGTLIDNEKIHVHGKHAVEILTEASAVNFIELESTPLYTLELTHGIDELDVYVNGNLQAEALHYRVVKNASDIITGVTFAPELLFVGDVVIFKWTLYNKYKD